MDAEAMDDLEIIAEFEVQVGVADGQMEQMRAANHIMNWWASIRPRLRQGDRLIVVREDISSERRPTQ